MTANGIFETMRGKRFLISKGIMISYEKRHFLTLLSYNYNKSISHLFQIIIIIYYFNRRLIP